MAVASLVLGIISLVIALFFGGIQWVGAIVGLIGIILGSQARKLGIKRGIANAGFVCSIIGFILSILFFVVCVLIIGAAGLMV